MSGVNAALFHGLVGELADELRGAAAAFVKRKGLGSFEARPLHQMSVNLTDAASELLMFGADLWPSHTGVGIVPAAETPSPLMKEAV
jgi:hypothetical protein